MKIPPTGIPLEDIERHALIEALKMSNWVQKDAAELLSISPRVDELQDQDARASSSPRPSRGAAAAASSSRRVVAVGVSARLEGGLFAHVEQLRCIDVRVALRRARGGHAQAVPG